MKFKRREPNGMEPKVYEDIRTSEGSKLTEEKPLKLES